MSNLSDRGTLRGTLQRNSGNYNDLINKPAINGHTLIGNQSGHALGLANEDDIICVEANPLGPATADLHKILVDGTIYSIPDVVVYGTASGAIASFDDGGNNKPLKSLKVAINPIQSGSGDPSPSNVRPISGWTGANVQRTGKNLVNIPDFNITSQYYGTYFYFKQGTYTFSINIKNNTTISGNIYLKKRDNSNIAVIAISSNMNSRANYTFTISEETEMRITASGSASGYSYEFKDIQIEAGNTATAYEPYNGTTYPITWSEAGEVFGGYVDYERKKVVAEFKMLNMGNINWSYVAANERFVANLDNCDTSRYSLNWLCECYKTSAVAYSDSDRTNDIITIQGARVYVRDSRYTDGTSLKQALNNLKMVYKLATPIEYDLDEPLPTITTLLGNNNIWSDTGEILECVYQRDLNIVINQFDARITALEQALNSSGTRSLSLSKSAVNEEETKEEITEEPKEEEQNEV